MPSIRCPHGCYFEMPALNWGVFCGFPDSLLTCDGCHRANPARMFRADADGGATQAVKKIVIPSRSRQEELDMTIRLRMLSALGFEKAHGSREMLLVEQVYAKLNLLLITAELTSNFPTPKIWQMLDSAGVFKNMWGKGESATSSYGAERDRGERQLFGQLDNVSLVPTGAGRPIYMALNPGCLQQGAAPFYGCSYLVYKDSVKNRCSFTSTDSLQMIKQDGELSALDVCSISTIGNILLRVSDKELAYLCSLVNNTMCKSPNEFIEAQCWGPINIASDVAIIVIAEPDLKRMELDQSAEGDLLPDHLRALSREERIKNIKVMKEKLRLFCEKHGIKLQYLALGGSTFDSREKRPT